MHRVLEREPQLRGRSKSLLRVVIERAHGNGGDGMRHRWRKTRNGCSVHELRQGAHLRRVGERRLAGEQIVEDGSNGERVRASVDLAAERLLAGHVLDFALERSGRRVPGTALACLGDSEVDHLGHAVARDQNVLGRDVAVHHVERRSLQVLHLVRGMQSAASVGKDAQDDPGRKPHPLLVAGAMQPLQWVAVDELHDDIEGVVLLAEVEDLDHVRMRDSGGDARLVEKHLPEFGVRGVVRQNRFDRDELFEAVLAPHAREPDIRHASLRENAEELVPVQPKPRLQRRGSGRCRAGHSPSEYRAKQGPGQDLRRFGMLCERVSHVPPRIELGSRAVHDASPDAPQEARVFGDDRRRGILSGIAPRLVPPKLLSDPVVPYPEGHVPAFRQDVRT